MTRCQMLLLASLILAVGCGRNAPVAPPSAAPSAAPQKPGAPTPPTPPVSPRPPTGTAVDEFRVREFTKAAEEFELAAKGAKGRLKSWNLMMAAGAWLEADDKTKALAAARAAVAAGPDDRSKTYAHKWHIAVGDVFVGTGEMPSAIQQYEAALKAAPDAETTAAAQQKLDAAKAKK